MTSLMIDTVLFSRLSLNPNDVIQLRADRRYSDLATPFLIDNARKDVREACIDLYAKINIDICNTRFP